MVNRSKSNRTFKPGAYLRSKSRSYKSRLILSFILISIIPLIIVQLVSYDTLNKTIRSNISSLIDQNLQQTSKSLDLLLSGYNDLLYQLYTDDDVVSNMENIGKGYEVAVNVNQLRRSLAKYCDAKPMIKCITMITPTGAVVSYDKLSPTSLKSSWLDAYAQEHPSYFTDIMQSRDTQIFSTGKPTLFGPTEYYLFHMAHRVIDYKNIYADSGIVIVSLDETLLEDLSGGMPGNEGPTSVSFLVDGSGMLVSFPKRAYIGTVYGRGDTEQYRKLITGNDVLKGDNIALATLPDEYTGWLIVTAVDQSLLFNKMAFQQQFTLLSILLLGVGLIAIIILLSNRLSSSITRIGKAISMAGEGELSVRIEPDRTMPPEMQAVANRFNRMLSEINALISDVKSATEKQKEAEIHALEAQINPHFIYNTLDTINWIAIDNSQYEISNMISALAKILRYAVENSNALVTVQDEVEWLRKYVFLQQTRLKYPFVFNIEVEEAAQGCLIHKLILQPFVENAILHGFSGMQGQCLLDIRFRAGEDYIEVLIQDNGVGLPPEMAELINRGNLPEERKRGHIGIQNVQERLEMYYGGQASVSAQSGEQGTQITIRVPANRQEAQE